MNCKTCGRKMVSYYGEKCFFCTPPSAENIVSYNLIEVLYHLEHKRPGLYERVWEMLCNEACIDNDCYKRGLFYEDLLEDYEDNSELVEDLRLLLANYPQDCLWEISW